MQLPRNGASFASGEKKSGRILTYTIYENISYYILPYIMYKYGIYSTMYNFHMRTSTIVVE